MTTEISIYTPAKKVGGKVAMLFGGGVLSLLLLVARFALELKTPAGKGSALSPGLFSGLAVIGIFSITYGIFLLRTPKRVRLDDAGILLEGYLTSRSVLWREIAQLRREQARGLWEKESLDVLVLCNDRGKTIASLNSLLANFPDLVAEVERRSTQARGVATFDRGQEIDRKRRQRTRTRKFAIGVFGFFTLMGIALGVHGIYSYRQESRLAKEGVETQAHVARYYMYNVTPRLEYTFENAAGKTFKRDIAMEKPAWDDLEGQTAVGIRFLPANPDWSHLRTGEASMESSPTQTILIGFGCATLFGFLLAAILMGYDVEHDPKTGRPRLRRASDVEAEMVARINQPAPPRPPPLPPVR